VKAVSVKRRIALALKDPKFAVKYLSPKARRVRRTENFISKMVPPCLVIDIGAAWFAHGRWRLFKFAADARWVLIDPNVESLAYADSWPYPSTVTTVPVAVSSSDGPITLHVTNTPTGSSTYLPAVPEAMSERISQAGRDYFFPMRSTVVDALSLHTILADCHPRAPGLVKLDTQGSELDILQSVEPWLLDGSIVGVELEATLLACPLYEGVPHFWQIQAWFEGLGWELLSLHVIEAPAQGSMRDSRSYVAECDAVFAPRRDTAAQMNDSARTVLLSFYVANGLYAEAENLLESDDALRDALESRSVDVNHLRDLLRRHI